MKQMCKKKPRLQTTVRHLGLESYIRHTQGWLKLIFLDTMLGYCYLTLGWDISILHPLLRLRPCYHILPNYFL